MTNEQPTHYYPPHPYGQPAVPHAYGQSMKVVTIDATRIAIAAAGVIGALMVIVGSVMPWVTVTSAFGGVSAAGTEGDGVLTLLAGVVLAGLAITAAFVRHISLTTTNIAAAVLLLVVAVYELANVSSHVAEAGNSELASASAGSGLYVLLVGALAVTAAAIAQAAIRR